MSREGGEGSEGEGDLHLWTRATVQCGFARHGFLGFLRFLRPLRGTQPVFNRIVPDKNQALAGGVPSAIRACHFSR